MYRRCNAHVLTAAVAAFAWVGVAAMIVACPGLDSAMRLVFFTVLSVASAASALALFPAVVAGYVQRRVDLLDVQLAAQAGYQLGMCDARRAAPDVNAPELRAVR